MYGSAINPSPLHSVPGGKFGTGVVVGGIIVVVGGFVSPVDAWVDVDHVVVVGTLVAD